MLDFWELLGRIAAEDTFRRDLINFKNSLPSAPTASLGSCDGCVTVFAPTDYDNLRGLVQREHPEIPISMAALGEWMLINMLHPLTDVLGNIAAHVAQVIGSSPSTDRQFYQALGLSIIDPIFALTFDGNQNKLGFSLNPSDLNAILKLNADISGFRGASQVFHVLYWDIDCKAWMFAQPSSALNHVHFLDPDEKTALSAQLEAAAVAAAHAG
jgi:hypothetical protein